MYHRCVTAKRRVAFNDFAGFDTTRRGCRDVAWVVATGRPQCSGRDASLVTDRDVEFGAGGRRPRRPNPAPRSSSEAVHLGLAPLEATADGERSRAVKTPCLPRRTRRADRQVVTAPRVGGWSRQLTRPRWRQPLGAVCAPSGNSERRLPEVASWRGCRGVAATRGRDDLRLLDVRTGPASEHDCGQVSEAVATTPSIGGATSVDRVIICQRP